MMLLILVTALCLSPLVLLGVSASPRGLAQKNIIFFRRFTTALVGLQLILAALALVLFAAGKIDGGEYGLNSARFFLSVYLDGASLMMLTLVSFVGWVISQFSIRYLDGEANQGRYYCWIAFTIGCVSAMVISANLGLFFVAWLMTSWGLHQLLLHYPERPAARRAAWTKFVVSRLGDAALLAALSLLYLEFGTLQISELLVAAGAHSTVPVALTTQFAGLLIALGVIAKSAQFPFHTWLPLTMETPTPVSALMHAGIVNAGGYLVIRLGPLMLLSGPAMTSLIVIGTFTACFGVIVMMTQTSVKRKLAYSTIAQMGFMLLQCGLGAFSAAMLHILAHSLYKSHAFLSSGSAMVHRASSQGALHSDRTPSLPSLISLMVLLMLFTGLTFYAMGINLLHKPGGLLLATLLVMALTQWLSQASLLSSPRLRWRAAVASAGLILLYAIGFAGIDALMGTPAAPPALTTTGLAVSLSVVFAFLWLFWLHWALSRSVQSTWLSALQVHAANGFYVESWLRRWFLSLMTS
jgi:NAD(P)H-quinone oxidoreductase subunit 5